MALLVSFCNQLLTPELSLLLIDENNLKSKWIELPSFSYPIVGCTGIEQVKNKYYVLTQSGRPELLVFTKDFKLGGEYPLLHTIDAHSLVYLNSSLFIVSTGDNSIYRIKLSEEGYPDGNEERFWSFPEFEYVEKDIVHLNSITCIDGELIITFFGKKKDETTWKTTNEGGCLNIMNNELLRTNIYHPHTARHVNDRLFICESNSARLLYTLSKNDYGKIDGEFQLNGYLRGFDYGNNHYFVGRSERRKISRSRGTESAEIEHQQFFPSAIFQLNESLTDMERVIDISAYGSEIYDIMYIPDFVLDGNDAIEKRVESLETKLTESRKNQQHLQQEHQALVQEHQALVQEHQTLQQTRAVILARKLKEHPLLMKLATMVYNLLATPYRFFRGK